MPVLVDTSVWIEYFRSGNRLDFIIDENLVVTNDLILAELIPFLKIRKQKNIIELLNDINKLQLRIKWDEIIDYQLRLLQKSVNSRFCHGELVEPYNEINKLQIPFDRLRVTIGDFCKSLSCNA